MLLSRRYELCCSSQITFVCVIINNKYAISVPDSLQYAAEKLSDRALGYGMHGIQVDGNDPIAVYKAMKEARERALAVKVQH